MGVRSPKDKHKKGEARNRPGKREKENINHETPLNRTNRESFIFTFFFNVGLPKQNRKPIRPSSGRNPKTSKTDEAICKPETEVNDRLAQYNFIYTKVQTTGASQ